MGQKLVLSNSYTLSPMEESVSGGDGPPIIVTAPGGGGGGAGLGTGGSGSGGGTLGGGGNPTGNTDTTPAGHILHVNLTNPTAAQTNAVKVLHDEINQIDSSIKKLSDTEKVTVQMSDGTYQTVTGAQVKALWAQEQIQIDPSGTAYGNGTGRGAATDAAGVTHFNIDTLTSYISSSAPLSNQKASADYLILHELGHDTAAGLAENAYEAAHGTKDAAGSYPDNEKFANTIAKAIEQAIGLSPLASVTYGYDTSNPQFAAPVAPVVPTQPGTPGSPIRPRQPSF